MVGLYIGIVVVAIIIFRILQKTVFTSKSSSGQLKPGPTKQLKPVKPGFQPFWTVLIFTKLSTRRFFRDRLAIFFGILFPLIFLFVFGSFSSSNSGNISFDVALINQSHSAFAEKFAEEIKSNKAFKVDKSNLDLAAAENKMSKSQLDGIIVLPLNFGMKEAGHSYPSGQLKVIYDESTASTGQTLTSILQDQLSRVNGSYVHIVQPFTAVGTQLSVKSLTAFDYTFAGLLGFTIIGLGIFGPVNVFPELKKQGILRRLHTTPLKVWQYFMATMFSQSATGLVSIAVMFVFAILVFHLKVDGNYLYIALFTILSIFMILGIGLAIGGWAKNERQAAPLANTIVFPMLFLSGTFFPRYIMPIWLQNVTNYLPLTPVIDGLRQLTTEGKSILDLGPQIGLIVVWLVVVYIIAFRVFKWE